MAINIIKLNNNIRQIDGFINYITIKDVPDGVAVSPITMIEQDMKIGDVYSNDRNVFLSKQGSLKLKKTDDNKIIIPSTVSGYEKIKKHLDSVKFTENKDLTEKMNELKAWQSKTVEEKEASAQATYDTYLAVLRLLSDGTMKNAAAQTPKDVATDGVKPGPSSADVVKMPYMMTLFDNKLNGIIVDAPVAVVNEPMFRPHPGAVGLRALGVQVYLFAVALGLNEAMAAKMGTPRFLPLMAQLPTMVLVGMAIAVVGLSIIAAVSSYMYYEVKARKIAGLDTVINGVFERNVQPMPGQETTNNNTSNTLLCWKNKNKNKNKKEIEMVDMSSSSSSVRMQDNQCRG